MPSERFERLECHCAQCRGSSPPDDDDDEGLQDYLDQYEQQREAAGDAAVAEVRPILEKHGVKADWFKEIIALVHDGVTEALHDKQTDEWRAGREYEAHVGQFPLSRLDYT